MPTQGLISWTPYKPQKGPYMAISVRAFIFSLITQHCNTFTVVGQNGLNKLVECVPVIFMDNVRKLMHHNIVYRCIRVAHEPPGKANSIFRAAAAKTCSCGRDLYPCRRHMHLFCIMRDTRRKIRRSTPFQRLYFLGIRLRILFCQCALPDALFRDPAAMLFEKRHQSPLAASAAAHGRLIRSPV